MDLGILAAVAMIAGWFVATFFFEAPGWVHGFLTVGLVLLIYRIVVRGTPGVYEKFTGSKNDKGGKSKN
jgi:hypothetical protein